MFIKQLRFLSKSRLFTVLLVVSLVSYISYTSNDSNSNQLFKNNFQDFKSGYPPKPIQSAETLELLKRLNLTNPGHLGEPVVLPENLDADIIERINKSENIYNFNEFVASLIPLDRQLADVRSDACKQLKYSKNFPVASVIIVFHNESPFLVLRTVYSILNESPPHLINEITLIDDSSSHGKRCCKESCLKTRKVKKP
jgi:hypothetical protein